jgi:hypothetical protein
MLASSVTMATLPIALMLFATMTKTRFATPSSYWMVTP